MKHTRNIALVMAGAWLNSAHAGDLTGRIDRADTGTFLEGARVTLSGTSLSTYTDESGRYSFKDVPAGDYTVSVDYLGIPSMSKAVSVPQTGTATSNVTLAEDIMELDEFVATGSLVGQARALNIEREATGVTSVVSSDAIGRFADQNAAESLQRLPGLSIQRDQGEGRFVSIRGIDPDLSNITLDGVNLASPEGTSRAVALDVIPAEILDQIVVSKAVDASMDGDAIGGSIDIQTLSPFDRGGQAIGFSSTVSYNDLVERYSGKAKTNYSNVFGADDQYGFQFSASFQERQLGSDNAEVDGSWDTTTDIDGNEAYFPDGEIEFRNYEITRERYAFSSGFETKPSDNVHLYVRGVYNYFSDQEERYRWELKPEDAADFQNLTDTSGIALNTEETDRDVKDRFEEQEIWVVSAGGSVELSDWTVDFNLALTHGSENEPDRLDTDFRMEGDDVSFAYDYAGLLPTVTNVGADDIFDGSNYEFNDAVVENNLSEEDEFSAKVDFTRDVDWGTGDSYIKFGAKFRSKEKSQDVNVEIYELADGFDYTLADVADPSDRFPFGNGPDGTYIRGSQSQIRERFENNPGQFELEDEDTLVDSAVDDYQSNEDIYAAYGQVNVSFDKLTVNAGLRIENTEFETTGNNVTFNADGDLESIESQSADKEYTDVLPSIIGRYDINDNLVLRASWTNTIARPKFGDSAFRQETNIEDEEVTVGNPDLDPYESSNFDVSLEYYFEPLGVFSISGFYKDIDSFIFESVIEDGINVRGEDYDLITSLNGESAEVYGVEFAWQQQFASLPSPFDGFGVYANLTLSESEANIGRDEEVRLPKQSDEVATLALTYEKYGFFFRIAGTKRGDFVDAFGGDFDEDEIHGEYFQWDVTSSYEITENITVFAEFLNVNEEAMERYIGYEERPLQYEEYGWSANLGVKVNF